MLGWVFLSSMQRRGQGFPLAWLVNFFCRRGVGGHNHENVLNIKNQKLYSVISVLFSMINLSVFNIKQHYHSFGHSLVLSFTWMGTFIYNTKKKTFGCCQFWPWYKCGRVVLITFCISYSWNSITKGRFWLQKCIFFVFLGGAAFSHYFLLLKETNFPTKKFKRD